MADTPKRKVDPERHKAFLTAVKPQGLIDGMKDMIIAMASAIQQKNPSTDTSNIVIRAFMLSDK